MAPASTAGNERPGGADYGAATSPASTSSASVRIEAARIRPCAGAVIELGGAGRLELSSSSELSLCYEDGALRLEGRLDLEGGTLEGPHFRAQQIRSTGLVDWRRGGALVLSEVQAFMRSLEWTTTGAGTSWTRRSPRRLVFGGDRSETSPRDGGEVRLQGSLQASGSTSAAGPMSAVVSVDERGLDHAVIEYHRLSDDG
ncbi:MAG: hypothetical protein HC923_07210 [Myxococcales bacterium]|nr:hypothetical protein [Myxococcales bacterium]